MLILIKPGKCWFCMQEVCGKCPGSVDFACRKCNFPQTKSAPLTDSPHHVRSDLITSDEIRFDRIRWNPIWSNSLESDFSEVDDRGLYSHQVQTPGPHQNLGPLCESNRPGIGGVCRLDPGVVDFVCGKLHFLQTKSTLPGHLPHTSCKQNQHFPGLI